MKKDAVISKNGVAEKKKRKEQKPYLTKRILISAANRGFRQAAKEAMELMGYVVIAKDGWVVKKFADGRIEKISPLELENVNYELRLD